MVATSKIIVALAAGASALVAPMRGPAKTTALAASKQTPHGGELVNLFAADAAAEVIQAARIIFADDASPTRVVRRPTQRDL